MARILTAIVGGYALANTASILLSYCLAFTGRAEAVMLGLLLSFTFYLLAVLWVFAVRSPARACLSIWGLALACGLLAWLLGPLGAVGNGV